MKSNKRILQILIFSLGILMNPAVIQANTVEGNFRGTLGSFFNSIFYTTASDGQLSSSRRSPTVPEPGPVSSFESLNPIIEGTFSYDLSAPRSPFSSTTAAFFPGISLISNLELPDVGTTTLTGASPSIQVFNSPSFSDFFSIGVNVNSNDLEAINLANPNPQTFTFDLLSDSNFADNATNLPSLAQFPVLLSVPQTLEGDSFSLSFSDTTGTVFSTTDLPSELNLDDFTSGAVVIQFAYDALVIVNPDDYNSAEDFQAASDYVANELTRVRITHTANANITEFSAAIIPEPSAILLSTLAAISFIGLRHRHSTL